MLKVDKKSILWNLRNGGLVRIEEIDMEDFEIAGICLDDLSDEALWQVITLLKKELMESLSGRIAAAVSEVNQIVPNS